MNKRQRKKLDEKLITAIRELNNDIAREEGFPLVTDDQIQEALIRIKKSKTSIKRTLMDYNRYILNAWRMKTEITYIKLFFLIILLFFAVGIIMSMPVLIIPIAIFIYLKYFRNN